jgi:glycosyltransferase involved in cell wall biosynthesis
LNTTRNQTKPALVPESSVQDKPAAPDGDKHRDRSEYVVTVIIPTYNRSGSIVQAIDSVLAQTHGQCEIIVVDDGSSDDTGATLAPYLERISYIYQENRGRSAARNVGIERATGEYVAFLDSDDAFLPEKLESQVRFLLRNPGVDVVYGNGYLADDRGISGPLPRDLVTPVHSNEPMEVLLALIRRSLFPPCFALFRRTSLDRGVRFDEELHVLEDWDLCLRLGLKGVRFLYHDDPVAIYRWYAGNTAQGIRALGRAGPAICARVVREDLDGHLPAAARQYFRLRHLDAILASRSTPVIFSALKTIVWPEGTFSLHGAASLAGRLVSLPYRPLRIFAKSLRRMFRSRVDAHGQHRGQIGGQQRANTDSD